MPAEQPFGRPQPARPDSVRTVSGTSAADSVRTVPRTRVLAVSLDRPDNPYKGGVRLHCPDGSHPLGRICSQILAAVRQRTPA